jgi:putative molybdopterin biosynthesis protein
MQPHVFPCRPYMTRAGLGPTDPVQALDEYGDRRDGRIAGESPLTIKVEGRACAMEFGLGFVPVGWEAFDFALKRGVYSRALLQRLLDALRGPDTQEYAGRLGGYDLEPAGDPIWGME